MRPDELFEAGDRRSIRSAAARAATGCQLSRMSLMKLVETTPGNFSLLLDAGSTPVDELIERRGHEPNGYF